MSADVFKSTFLHCLLMRFNVLLHPLLPSCFLCSPYFLLASSLPLVAPHLTSEAFPPLPPTGGLSGRGHVGTWDMSPCRHGGGGYTGLCARAGGATEGLGWADVCCTLQVWVWGKGGGWVDCGKIWSCGAASCFIISRV